MVLERPVDALMVMSKHPSKQRSVNEGSQSAIILALLNLYNPHNLSPLALYKTYNFRFSKGISTKSVSYPHNLVILIIWPFSILSNGGLVGSNTTTGAILLF